MATAELHRLDLNADKFRAIPARDRYVFALAGHIFNEVMTLQKLLMTAKPKPGAHPFETEGAAGMAILFLKLLVGKTHEAMSTLTRQSVAHILRDSFFHRHGGLQDRWEAAVARYEALEWMGKIRNTAAFHYMRAGQWPEHADEAMCTEAHVIVGKRYSQTFFHWQDALAALSMMKHVNGDDPIEGLGLMIEELGGVAGDLCECLANGLQAYMVEVLTIDGALGPVVELSAPMIEATSIPYFYASKE